VWSIDPWMALKVFDLPRTCLHSLQDTSSLKEGGLTIAKLPGKATSIFFYVLERSSKWAMAFDRLVRV